jgi:tetratricopeptide (TPR) repeat protein
MLTNEELESLYQKEFADCQTFQEVSDKLAAMKSEHIDDLRGAFCNELLYMISTGYTKYGKINFEKDELIRLLCKNIQLISSGYTYMKAVNAFFKHENKKCLKLLENWLEESYQKTKNTIKKPEEFLDEGCFVDTCFEPFKEAFSGFWKSLGQLLKKYPCQNGIAELCEIIDTYYQCKTDDEALDMLLDAMQKYPEIILIKELIAYTYYSMKMWNNAIAYLEQIEESSIFFRKYDVYFMLAWSYGKLRKRRLEEEYYRKSLDENAYNINTINNLGFCLYKQKKFTEAKMLFEQCLEMDQNHTYASNNYVRVLIALGRNEDAKVFVNSGKYKISKEFKRRVEKLDDTNARIKKSVEKEDVIESNDEENGQKNSVDLGIERQQFSNEKLLEDELTARIESGKSVFGMKLKVYRRKGLYGRQFMIPVGRLDLLCEDHEGNLYVIELKKDSGYDDAYRQTAAYLDWFEHSEEYKGKMVYGIICLNSPTQELVEKVHQDKRMRIYEYQISYTEL